MKTDLETKPEEFEKLEFLAWEEKTKTKKKHNNLNYLINNNNFIFYFKENLKIKFLSNNFF